MVVAALVKLEHTNILDRLSTDLTTNLLNKIAGSSLVNIQKLDLDLRKSSSVPPELFGEALVKMETVILYTSGELINGTGDQVLSLFRKIVSSEEMRIKELDLSYLNLTIPHISPDIVSEAVVKLETLKLSHS